MQGGRPIKSWASELDPSALEQATNLSKLPFAMRHVALMPDAHGGYGMPIGGVLFAERAIVPYAIGMDIGCGVAFAETDLTVDVLAPALQQVCETIEATIPTGFKTLREPVAEDDALGSIDQALRRMGEPDVIDDLLGYDAEAAKFFRESLVQLGTLGGGNHFIELQADEAGRVYLMLHSGSRAYGAKVCKSSHKKALDLNRAWHSRLPHDELAFLPIESDVFQQYWNRMQFGLAFAEVSRDRMVAAALEVLRELTPMRMWRQTLDVHHNYAAWENHFGKNGIVHRKGAVRARKDELVAIPGSMGTGSYIARGLGNADAFNTCQHGAGRAKTRTAMRRSMSSADVFAEMGQLGVVLVSSDPSQVMEEAPGAYKDIENVMSQSADLIEPTLKLRPLGVVKG